MKTIIISFFVFILNSSQVLAKESKSQLGFVEGQYKSDKIDCEERTLHFINDDKSTILFFGQDVALELQGPSVVKEDVPEGCHYQFKYDRSGNHVKRIETRSDCPKTNENGELTIEVTKKNDGSIQLRKTGIDQNKKVKEELCTYKKL
ncbi:MAG: hypothetical protein COW00_11455 [Bdellovibrio sp. CG12_big_fil_rev_8_21_14_0_65_39_13]|nr:MAG: hypothetical protein COW78_04865 [Bdellovibrio sp. CG22_combo_CG10-13_8_21_14_all_39_27]PIQ59338.1 MAG: hypothetical protein COW00_11455 [Bdellovibrio sp. CG12_big_fil_rev_8_21_14_0_65_39_13]PIR32759.1 MAG: hypothetical protein COV37_18710 [Bdellovibrio sp. CG11_big_fil_rev_8_21_14_0_20_39_38]